MPKGKAAPKGGAAGWKNRIVFSGVRPADQFLAHPDNWRKHGSVQEEALVAVLDRVGWVQDVLVSRRTGFTLDGHLRVLVALRKGDQTPVPYSEVDVTENEEALILSVLDPIGALASTDDIKLKELMDLLPEEELALARLVHAEKTGTKVEFVAKEKFKVTVECENEVTMIQLAERLTTEGFKVKTTT